jgi:dihydrofolate reductase
MRKLILKMSISVDGFVGGPNGELDWMFPTMDEQVVAWQVDTLWQAGVHIAGSRTFRDMAAYYPTSLAPYAAPMNEIPKVYFSRTGAVVGETTRALADARSNSGTASSARVGAADSWNEARAASGDLGAEIARLKAEGGKDIIAHGGASFANSLVRLGVVDEYRLLIHPVALGRGLALFGDVSPPLELSLADVTTFKSGAVVHVYRPVGG